MIELGIVQDPVQDFMAGLVQITIGVSVFYPEYRNKPREFAKDILGVEWTDDIAAIAESLLTYRKVVVPAGHAVGKTHGVAGIAIWWLATRKTKVVTTAPTWRQVKDLIWREIRSQHRRSIRPVPGKPLTLTWDLEEDWFATGISTNDPVRFQGYHSEELLVILDEACGVEKFIWDAIEDGLAVSEGNRILAIGNPTDPTGRFAQVCRSSEWKKFTLSCIDHPNVVEEKSIIPGAVTRSWVFERVKRWCIPYEKELTSDVPADLFEFENTWYIPNDLFRIRILGQFPIEGGDQIFPLAFINKAFNREPKVIEGSPCMGLDVARFGDDLSVLCIGTDNYVALHIDPWQGARTTESAGRVKYWVSNTESKHGRVKLIAVDAIGLGAGVADELISSGYSAIDVNVAMKPYDEELYTNLRDELTFAFANALRQGKVDLTRIRGFEEQITEELGAFTFDYTKKGQRKVSAKKDIKEKLGRSPNFADALVLWNGHVESGYLSAVVVDKGSQWQKEPQTWNELF